MFRARLPLNKGYPDLSGSFWNKLTLFVTGMIAQAVDLRELHQHSIKSRPNRVQNWSMPHHVQLPSIDVALSGIFPSMVFENVEQETPTNALTELSAGQLPSMLGPMTGHNLTSRPPWANDILTIQFKGVQAQANTSEGGATAPLMCTSDAIIKVRRPQKYTALQRTVDRNVFYSPERGEFLLRIRHGVGEAILPQLKSRIQAVDRFVNFVESMDRAKGTIRGEQVSLRYVSFSYPGPEANAGDDKAQAQRLAVALDLSNKDIEIRLEHGNPHLRVIDLMRSLVNIKGGIEALMIWLPSSLPALQVIQQMELAWSNVQAQRRGRIDFSMKNIDWFSLRYTLEGPAGVPKQQQQTRHLLFEVRIKIRRGEPWWHIWRVGPAGEAVFVEDGFTQLLRPLWETKGEDWHGLGTSAAARPNSGVVRMLTTLDDTVRSLIALQ